MYTIKCALEEENRVWNRITDSLPPGQLSFILRAASDTLPTPVNLECWRYPDSKCHPCGSPSPTVFHILSSCPTSLNQGRMTWCYDSVLWKLVQGATSILTDEDIMYADLPGYRASDPPATIQAQNISATSACPDLVIVRRKEAVLIEQTIPYNSPEALNNTRRRKE